ncbi:MAG: S8 family serine peptidase, partial [Nanoarchaeota archaeon]|nr:S8 family serine peptidase [Nanoarchaeota archaeon]
MENTSSSVNYRLLILSVISFSLILTLSVSSFASDGYLVPFLVSPTGNFEVTVNTTFNVTTGVVCLGGTCDNIVAKLDPVSSGAYVDDEIASNIESDGKARVIIMLKETSLPAEKEGISSVAEIRVERLDSIREMVKGQQDAVLDRLSQQESIASGTGPEGFILKRRYAVVNALAAEIDQNTLDLLKNDPAIKSIYLDTIEHISLTESIPLINADDTWKIQVNGMNVTGNNLAACVVDTGINASHPGFGGRVVAEQCYCSYGGACCPEGGITSDNATDDEGHGTHVAGIIAANYGSYKGVAPDAKIVAIKSLDSNGYGYQSDIAYGIDWCVNHSMDYNITVISLSLGGGAYTSACDGNSNLEDYEQAIDAAVGQNIIVIAASGNNGNITGISHPACLINATAVGAVYDANVGSKGWCRNGGCTLTCTDSTTISDKLVCFTNRNSLLDLLAPGSVTTSLNYQGVNYDGGTLDESGTSQATPHVSGAALLMQSFYEQKYSYLPSPSEIVIKLKQSGKPIYDINTSTTYQRINLENALPKGVIPERASWNGVDPFYTTSSNPGNTACLSGITTGQTCNTTWTVNATQLGTWEFFTIYELNATQNLTNKFNVTVVAPSSGTLQNITITKYSSASKVTLGENFTFTIVVSNTGNVNITNVSVGDLFNTTTINFTASNISTSDVFYNIGEVWWMFNLSVGESVFIQANFSSIATGNFTNNATAENWTRDTKSNSMVALEIAAAGILDETAPAITGVNNQSTTNQSTLITWGTNEASNSSVSYGITEALS